MVLDMIQRVRRGSKLTLPAPSVADGEEEMAVPVAEPEAEPEPAAPPLPSSEPPLLPGWVVSTTRMVINEDIEKLTLAEVGAVGDDLVSVWAAGLVGAVTDTVGEVALVAEAGSISRGAAKSGGLGEHVLHALLLDDVLVIVSWCCLGGKLCVLGELTRMEVH